MEFKKRRKAVAVLLNLFFPSLGTFYATFVRRALVLVLLDLIINLLIELLIWVNGVGFAMGIAAYLGLTLFFCIDGYRMASRANRQQRTLSRFNRVYVYLPYIVILIFISYLSGVLIREYVAEASDIPSASMEPTLLEGDQLISDKTDRNFQRGDVVIFKYPDGKNSLFIKRIVAVPGDTITIEDERLTINGVEVERERLEQFVSTSPEDADQDLRIFRETNNGRSYRVLYSSTPAILRGKIERTLGAGVYYMLGDNRNNSNDSRFFGPVEKKDITAKANYIYWPLERFGRKIN